MDDATHEGQHSIKFTEKRWCEFISDYFRFLRSEVPSLIALTASLWAAAEIVIKAAGNEVPAAELAASIVTVSVMTVGIKAYGRFKIYVPSALELESNNAREIFRKQRCGWQLALTRQMLIDRIDQAEVELSRISRGAAFVAPRHLSGSDYMAWLISRPETAIRLVQSVAILCTQDLPVIVADVTTEAHLDRLKLEVEALAALYEVAKKFEIECHEIVPPGPFEEVHEMIHGWTQPIRRGVSEFLNVLDTLASLDAKSLKAGKVEPPSFNIVFNAPDNIDEFSESLRGVDASQVIDYERIA